MEQSFGQFLDAWKRLSERGVPFVVVTLVGTRGHAPQDVGARMIVGADAILFGTIGGGKLEKKCLDLAREKLKQQNAALRESLLWNLTRDVGMSCGGEVQVLFEVFSKALEWNVCVFGAGHVGQEVVRLLLKTNANLTVVDSRIEWLDKLPRSSRYRKLLLSDMKSILSQLPKNTAIACMTMGHSTDYPILLEALKDHGFPYVGVLGSKVKRIKLNSELKAEGLTDSKIKSFHCPMGLDFGSNSPFEIAMSIVAELISLRDASQSARQP